MAILKRVSNRQGDGAGRALYALKHAIAVRTDIPSLLSFVLDGEFSSELRRELAMEFNRHLLLHQGSYKTQHYVVSFGHHLTPKEIEKVLDRLERLFEDPYRYHLFVVHQESHGTAVHIIESADSEGRLRHLSRKEFFDLKRAVIKELRPFLNERELEVAKNFSRNIATEDWKHPIEVFAPERSFKEYIRQVVKEASQLIEKGNIAGAVELLKFRGIEIVEKKAGELSPNGKLLKRDRLYAILNHPYRGVIAVRLDKKMRATYQRYLKAFREFEDELKRAKQRIDELSSEVKAVEGRHRGAGKEERFVEARSPNAGGVESIKERLKELECELEKSEELLNELRKSNEQLKNGIEEPQEWIEQGEEVHSNSSVLDRVGMDSCNRSSGDSNSRYSSIVSGKGNSPDANVDRKNLSGTFPNSEVEMLIPREVIDEIKQLPPEKVLSYLGIPYKQVGNRIMAQAVWRGEKEASVSIQFRDGKWLWYDFGTGEGGDWIDLYRRYTGSDFRKAVSILMEFSINLAYTPNISTREPDFGRKKKTSSLWQAKTAKFEELEKVPLRELQELPKDLAEYLEQKGFMPYWERIKEIPELYYLRYRRGKKEYSGLATKTITGSWIVKTKITKEGMEIFKTYVSKDSGLSLWRRDPSKMIVVEGFTDAMALAIDSRFKDYSILILNGLGNLKKAIGVLKVLPPFKLYIALDLDERGLEGRKKLVNEFPKARHIYFYGKDPAEYLSSNEHKVRKYLLPFCDEWLTSPNSLYHYLLPSYFGRGFSEKILKEFSPTAYYAYWKASAIEEEMRGMEEELKKFEEYNLPDSEPEEDKPEDRNRGISFGP